MQINEYHLHALVVKHNKAVEWLQMKTVYAIFSLNQFSPHLCQKDLKQQIPEYVQDTLRNSNSLHKLLCYFAWPSMTFSESQALVNKLASGTWFTVEIMRVRSGNNWVWLRTFFKGTPFSSADPLEDEGAWTLAPVVCLCSCLHFENKFLKQCSLLCLTDLHGCIYSFQNDIFLLNNHF